MASLQDITRARGELHVGARQRCIDAAAVCRPAICAQRRAAIALLPGLRRLRLEVSLSAKSFAGGTAENWCPEAAR